MFNQDPAYIDRVHKWVDSTFTLVTVLLDLAGVPYEFGDDSLDLVDFYTHQLRFPWAMESYMESAPDVVIGMLHADDLMAINKDLPWSVRPYPSIETYGFPWDNDDITVFTNPVAFVKKVKDHYIFMTSKQGG